MLSPENSSSANSFCTMRGTAIIVVMRFFAMTLTVFFALKIGNNTDRMFVDIDACTPTQSPKP